MTHLADAVAELSRATRDQIVAPDYLFADDPVGWVKERLGESMWSAQVELCEAVRDHRFVAVKACHGPGKSYTASRLAAWWLSRYPIGEAFVVSTAPSWRQVSEILWRELGRAKERGGLPGRINLEAQWYAASGELIARGYSPAEHDEQTFQGIHARHLLVIIDEACGVSRDLFDAVESLATTESARVVALGNPDDPSSYFERVCRAGSGWEVLTISAFDTPAFTGEEVAPGLLELLTSETWVEERKQRWGESSNRYISKVLAQFPPAGEDTLFPDALLRDAVENHIDSAAASAGRYAVDVARYGNDETVCYRNRDGLVRHVFSMRKASTMHTAGRVRAQLAKHPAYEVVPVVVDEVGVGAGVFDRLREVGEPALGYSGSRRAHEPGRFFNTRAEMYWGFRESLERGEVDLDGGDEELLSQLGSMRYVIDSSNRVKIETKAEARKRGLASPDRADAVIMTQWRREATAAVAVKGNAYAGDILSVDW